MTDKHAHSANRRMTRRQFVASAASLAGAAGLAGVLPRSLARVAAATLPRGFDLGPGVSQHLPRQLRG